MKPATAARGGVHHNVHHQLTSNPNTAAHAQGSGQLDTTDNAAARRSVHIRPLPLGMQQEWRKQQEEQRQEQQRQEQQRQEQQRQERLQQERLQQEQQRQEQQQKQEQQRQEQQRQERLQQEQQRQERLQQEQQRQEQQQKQEQQRQEQLDELPANTAEGATSSAPAVIVTNPASVAQRTTALPGSRSKIRAKPK